MKQVYAVTYVGADDEKFDALILGTPGAEADLYVLRDGGVEKLNNVPKREYPSDDGNGHTWH